MDERRPEPHRARLRGGDHWAARSWPDERLPADAGYFNEANVTACAAAGIEPIIATDPEVHHARRGKIEARAGHSSPRNCLSAHNAAMCSSPPSTSSVRALGGKRRLVAAFGGHPPSLSPASRHRPQQPRATKSRSATLSVSVTQDIRRAGPVRNKQKFLVILSRENHFLTLCTPIEAIPGVDNTICE